MDQPPPRIAVLGASGLIGEAVARALLQGGFPVVAVGRRFTASQQQAFGTACVTAPFVAGGGAALRAIFRAHAVDIVVNCTGVLQDGPSGATGSVHDMFVAHLLSALADAENPVLLVHVSVPGDAASDPSPFSRSKRIAERSIVNGPVPFVILRPGFVIAPAAYGGSALIRALAQAPFALPARDAGRTFAVTAVSDVAQTIAILARRFHAGEHAWREVWDVLEQNPGTLGDVVGAFRGHFGGPAPRLALRGWMMDAGAVAGDMAGWLGWLPPIRTNAVRELRRGVSGDPASWMMATGLRPQPLMAAVLGLPSTIQERWFGRLYMRKALIVLSLAAFWMASGLIVLTGAFDAARGILTAHGVPFALATGTTLATSLLDIGVGMAIARKSTCRAGLLAGILTSVAYLAGATLLAPGLWLAPLGALVKTVPVVVMMIAALGMVEDR